ncbi:EpsG family protein [Butyrivibrio sp. YAB3001]|uniref:EpsG family protein n=1 Tax=Butyrivibrio sp. YAB3001 TaxID=1520812 RepID=UPI0008F64541|nr:EpsG family protein [Butyrivibrio sp. YAB3001]SFB88866.1 EpsG family protein [Butyrivibrio sp. YAB3001]
MNFYLQLLGIVVIVSFIEFKLCNNEKQVLLYIKRGLFPCVLLCCVSGLRSLEVGKDNYSYSRYFLKMTFDRVHFFNPNFYWIYNLWDYVIRQFTDKVYVFNFLCALVIYISLYLFITRYSCDERVSLILFITLGIFFNSMNQTRQALATAILLLGFKYAVDKNIVKAMLLCFIAAFVHNVAVVMIPIYAFFCLAPRIGPRVVAFFSGASIVIALSYNRLIGIFVSIFPKYRYYLKYSKLFVERRSIYRYGDFFMALIIQLVLIYGLYKLKLRENVNTENNYNKRREENDEFGNILACMNAVYLCMTYLILNSDIFNRLKSLFVYWVILTIPFIIKKYFKDNFGIKVLVCVVSMAYMFRLGVHDGDGVIPYKLFFDWKKVLF